MRPTRAAVSPASTRWDNTVAILTGDFLFARASEIAADLGPEVCRLLARTIAVLCDGQIREVDSAGKSDQTEENYIEIIRRKTGSLIATSCRLGAMMSDAPEEHIEILGDFGESWAWPSSSPTTSWTSPPASWSSARSRGWT